MSASVSKIPVAKHRRLSPDRPSPVMSPASSPQKSVSKLPVKVSKSEIGHFKENICSDFRPTTENNAVKWMSDAPVTSPSRIPVMKSYGDVTSPSECVTPRNHSSANHTSSHNRPQSIDLEDEYIQGLRCSHHFLKFGDKLSLFEKCYTKWSSLSINFSKECFFSNIVFQAKVTSYLILQK